MNAVIYRLEQKKSLAGRSLCPHCKHSLAWVDLFPVLSFILLQGKCRYCKKKISWQYPLVELSTAVMFVLIFLQGSFVFWYLNLALLLYVASVLIIIFVYDAKHYLIPDKILLPALAITFLYRLLHFYTFLNFAIAAILASLFFLIIFLISKGKWMGFGDVKLALLLGLLLGLQNVLVALFLAFLSGAVVGIVLLIFGKKNMKSELPFAPFLVAGTFLALLWGNQLISWYINLLL